MRITRRQRRMIPDLVAAEIARRLAVEDAQQDRAAVLDAIRRRTLTAAAARARSLAQASSDPLRVAQCRATAAQIDDALRVRLSAGIDHAD